MQIVQEPWNSFSSRVGRFLKKRGVWRDCTLDDFRREGEITAPLLDQRQNKIEQRG
jgi:hypothetical protein